MRVCPECGVILASTRRVDTRVCSPRCRQRRKRALNPVKKGPCEPITKLP